MPQFRLGHGSLKAAIACYRGKKYYFSCSIWKIWKKINLPRLVFFENIFLILRLAENKVKKICFRMISVKRKRHPSFSQPLCSRVGSCAQTLRTIMRTTFHLSFFRSLHWSSWRIFFFNFSLITEIWRPPSPVIEENNIIFLVFFHYLENIKKIKFASFSFCAL